ncbi:MAG: MSMEG_1061 family FMN-dependent PPOX-type flavoprotein, partial [Haloechinothrix sp.]
MTTTDTRAANHRLGSEEELRAVIGSPSTLVLEKELDRLDAHCAAFIALSPMVIVATSDADGRCDASPRGDPPGFVKVLGSTTVLIPDRKGNRRIDTMVNLTANPRIGLLFLIPGVNETLRANGTAAITEDLELLDTCAVNGKSPKLGIIVT